MSDKRTTRSILSVGLTLAGSLLLAACSDTEPPGADNSAVATSNQPDVTETVPAELTPEQLRALPILVDPRSVQQRVRDSFSAPGRPPEDAYQHGVRKVDQVIPWAGLEDGMSVIDITSFDGYYAEAMAWAVDLGGWVVAHNTPGTTDLEGGAVGERLQSRVFNTRLPHMEIYEAEFIQLPELFDAEFDVASWVNTFHDTYHFGGQEAAARATRAVFDILKPGGTLLLIDHLGIEGADNRRLHRIPPQIVEQMLIDAGFEIVDHSDLLRLASDDPAKSIFDAEVRGRTSRFILKARKPL